MGELPFIFVSGLSAQHIPARFADMPVCAKPAEPDIVAVALNGMVRWP